MATEYPPLGKAFVAEYRYGNRDFPIVHIKKDPRVENYKSPEVGDPCPDKRFPNHTFIQVLPTNTDERVLWVYEKLDGPVISGSIIDNDGNFATLSRQPVAAGSRVEGAFGITSNAINPENQALGIKETVKVENFEPLRGVQIDPRYGVALEYTKELVDAETAVGGIDGLESVEIEPKNQWHSWRLSTKLSQLPADQVWYGYKKESFPDVLVNLQIVGTENFQSVPTWRVVPDMPLKARFTRKFSLGPPPDPQQLISPKYWAEPFYLAIEYTRTSFTQSVNSSQSTSSSESSGTNQSTSSSSSSTSSSSTSSSSSVSSSGGTSSSSNSSVSSSTSSGLSSSVNSGSSSSSSGGSSSSANQGSNSSSGSGSSSSSGNSSGTSSSSSTSSSSGTNSSSGGSSGSSSSSNSSTGSSSGSGSSTSSGGGAGSSTSFTNSTSESSNRGNSGDSTRSSNRDQVFVTDPVVSRATTFGGQSFSDVQTATTGENQSQSSNTQISQTENQTSNTSSSSGSTSSNSSSQGTSTGQNTSSSSGQNSSQSASSGTSISSNSGTSTSSSTSQTTSSSNSLSSSSSISSSTSSGISESSSQNSGVSISSNSSTSSSVSNNISVSSSIGSSLSESQSLNNTTSNSESENQNTSIGKSIFNLSIPKCIRNNIDVSLPTGETFTIPATRQTDLDWGSYVEVSRQSEHWKQGIWITEISEVYLPSL